MSREMAFQFSGAKLVELIALSQTRVGKVPKARLEAALVEEFPDERERNMVRAAIIVLVKCYDANRDFRNVKNVIVWRGPDGSPSEIEISFHTKAGAEVRQ